MEKSFNFFMNMNNFNKLGNELGDFYRLLVAENQYQKADD